MKPSVWIKDRPTAPGDYLCRFVPGWEFVVTVTEGRAGLIAEWKGRAALDVPVYVASGFFDRAEWCAPPALAVRETAEASS